MRAERLIDLVALLRRHERITAAELADRLGVSRRTVLRDLDALSLSGVPVYAEHGRGGGFSILPGYRPETAGLTAAELEALFLPGGATAAKAVGREAEFRSAQRKLEAVLSDDTARGVGALESWLLVVPEGWGQPTPAPTAVAELAAAAARREVVDLDYHAIGQATALRRVRPLGLVLAGRIWYLLALRDDSGEQRTYRADRVAAVIPTGRGFEPPLTLAAAWERARESFRSRPGVVVRLRVRRDDLPVVRYVVSLVGRVSDVHGGDDDHVELTGVAPRIEEAATILAGIGERAQILGPPELIEAVLAVSRSNLARYGPD